MGLFRRFFDNFGTSCDASMVEAPERVAFHDVPSSFVHPDRTTASLRHQWQDLTVNFAGQACLHRVRSFVDRFTGDVSHLHHSYRGFLPKTLMYSASPPLARTFAWLTQSSRSMRPRKLR